MMMSLAPPESDAELSDFVKYLLQGSGVGEDVIDFAALRKELENETQFISQENVSSSPGDWKDTDDKVRQHHRVCDDGRGRGGNLCLIHLVWGWLV
jgi:hypothetical protein